MKYSKNNEPIICMLKNNECYKNTNKMKPKGVLWHDTSAGNPYISRYVQPLETDEDYEEKMKLLGDNKYNNDWNHSNRRAGVNCFIGKLADNSIATVQTMPWDYAPWACGSGPKGSLNNTHMQFEICDDGYKSKEYFEAVYKEACEITAYYCKMYNLNPFGTFIYNGVTVPVITNHKESYRLGLGNDHSDTEKWMKIFGKTMDDARKDVAKLMGISVPEKETPKEEKEEKGKYTKGKSEKLSTNFKSTEFDCHGKNCCSNTYIDDKLVEYLQKIRTHFNKPLNISSGYRCQIHNKNIGSSTSSYHTKGQAADIYINGITPLEIARYAEKIGILGIGLYETDKDGHFVHIDVRTTKAFWYGQKQEKRNTFQEEKIDISKVETSPANPKKVWDFLKSKGLNDFGIAGLMGNLYAESGLSPINLQNSHEKKLGYTDAEYTAVVDQGIYDNFVKDGAGYGLAQWTHQNRKQELLNFCKLKKASIGDLNIQLEFLVKELSENYKNVWNILKTATSVAEASNAVLLQYERPADQSLTAQTARAKYGQDYYDKYKTLESANNNQKEEKIFKENDIVKLAANAIYYSGKTIPTWVKEETWIVSSVKGDRVVINKSIDGKHAINSPVNAKFLELVTNSEPKKEENKEKFSPYLVKVNVGVLNYRSGPGLDYKIKGTVRRGQIYTIVEEKNGWGKLKSGAGWLRLDYIEKI